MYILEKKPFMKDMSKMCSTPVMEEVYEHSLFPRTRH
jgi:hypothetical protein